ncbi:MAG: DUF4296 domain-containing protein [Muribaculaceae bacterium]|nr:DUF4296 domain-containing protein [Muribaculaceae bacterium]
MKSNRRTYRFLLPVWVLALAVLGCTGVPDSVIQPHDMAKLLADIHIGEAVVETNTASFSSDSAKYRLKLAIYAKHGVTQAMVDSSLQWYGYHMDKYVEVYDEVASLLEERLLIAEDQAGVAGRTLQHSLAMEGDSVDVWPGVRVRRFASSMPSQAMSFGFNSDPNWERGDIYTFRGKMLHNDSRAMLSMAMDYTDGTVEYVSKPLIGDGWHEVRIAADSSRLLRDVYGTLSFEPQPGHVTFIDSVSLTRTRLKPDKHWVRDDMLKLSPKPHVR